MKACGVVLLVTGVVWMLATAVMPRKYQGQVSMWIDVPGVPMDASGHPATPVAHDHPYLLAQLSELLSESNAAAVVDKLGLVPRWGAADSGDAGRRLLAMAEVKRVRAQGFELSVWSRNPAEAAELANALADEYVQRRLAREAEELLAPMLVRSGLGPAMEGGLRAAWDRMQAVKARYGIVDASTDEDTLEGLRRVGWRREHPGRPDRPLIKTALREGSPDDLIRVGAVAGVIGTWDSDYVQHLADEAFLASKVEEQGRGHPEVERLTQLFRARRETLAIRVKYALYAVLDDPRYGSQPVEASPGEDPVRAATDAEERAAAAEYQRAKDDYFRRAEAERMGRAEAVKGFEALRARVKFPTIIHARATEPARPERPKVPLHLALAGLTSLAGAVLLVGGFMVHPHRARPAISPV